MKLPDAIRGAGLFPRTHAPEHANLVDDVIPAPGCLEFFRQQSVQLLPHRDDPVCHHRYVCFPLPIQHIMGQDQGHLVTCFNKHNSVQPFTYQPCSVRGWIADFTPRKHRQLAPDATCRVLVPGNHMQSSNPFTIQSCILRKTLFKCSVQHPRDYMDRHTWHTSIGTPRDTK